MKAYYFRVIDDNGKPTGHVGMVAGVNWSDIFWTIDEFVDPYSVEVKRATAGGFCYYLDESDEEDIQSREYEFGIQTPFPSDKGWKKPEWVLRDMRDEIL